MCVSNIPFETIPVRYEILLILRSRTNGVDFTESGRRTGVAVRT